MILIITHKEDYTCDFIINKLNKRGISYKRLNCEDINEIFYLVENNIYKIDNDHHYTSVWFRRTKLPEINNLDYQEYQYILNEYDSLLKNLFSIIEAKWVSDPFSIYRAENKLLQLKIAKKLQFNVPNTLVTNSKEELKKFYYQNNEDIIIKPLSQGRIIKSDKTAFLFTNSIHKKHIENIEEYDITPCIFQNRIDKDYELRVTVVGEKVFPAKVNSQILDDTKLDWRRSKLKFYSTTIPQDISEKCINIVKALNLKFGAIDIVKDKNGSYIFLEINPNGQWAWIEAETGLPISEEIINQLI